MINNNFRELQQQLSQAGKQKRDEEAKRDENGSIVKRSHLKPREVADVLEKYIEFARIVDDKHSGKDKDTATLMFRDPEQGIFIHQTSRLEDLINLVDRNIDQNGAKRILYWLQREAPYRQRTKATYLVPVGNGVYNLHSYKLESYDDYVFTSKVSTDYEDNPAVPNLNGWKADEWITNDICEGDSDKEKLFWQAVYCAVNPNDNKKGCLLLVDDGKGNTGKGTVQELLTQLVGKDNRADLSFEDFESDFKLSRAVNAALIIGDDNDPDLFIKSSRKLKSIIAKESILFNPKFEQPFSYTMTAFIIQSMNGMPRFKDTSGAMYDRFRAIKFNKRYEGKQLNPAVKNKYVKDKSVLKWLLFKALHQEPFKRMIKTKESNEVLHSAQIDGNPLLGFVEEHIDEFTSSVIPKDALYSIFQTVYTYDNGTRSKMKRQTFIRRIKPIMATHGWKYKKDKRVKDGWNEKDKEHFLNKYDLNYLNYNPGTYEFPFTVSADDKGVFYKE